MLMYMDEAIEGEGGNFLLDDPAFAELWAPNGASPSISLLISLANFCSGTLLGLGDILYRRNYAE